MWHKCSRKAGRSSGSGRHKGRSKVGTISTAQVGTKGAKEADIICCTDRYNQRIKKQQQQRHLA